MARFIVETDAKSADDLYGFDYGGYQFAPAFSRPDAPCFVRDPEAS